MKAKLLLFAGVFGLVSVFMASCVKEEFDMDTITATNWDPNAAAPLINSSLTLWDIMNDYDSTDLLVVDSNQFVYLIYEDTVYSQSAEELISIGNQSLNYSDNMVLGTYSGDYVFDYDYNFDLSLGGGMELDSMILKGGDLAMAMNSDLSYPATIVMTIPGSTLNGNPFSVTLNYSGSGSSISQNLTGAKLIFDNSVVSNRLAVHFKVTIHGNGGANNATYANFNMNLNNLLFRYLYGYLGQFDLSMNNDTIGIKVYNNSFEGTVNWYDPRLYINVYNGWGVPIRSTVDYLEAIRTNAPANSVIINGAGIPNPWDINYPTSMGSYATSSFYLDKNNSNIDAALNITPQRILALVSGSTNPNGNVVKNFVEDVSRMAVEAKLELPFYGTADGFVLQDTFDISFGEDLSHVEWIMFKLYTNNMFPIDGTVQVYFCDSLNNRLDSLLNPIDQVLLSAIPGPAPDYIVTSPVAKTVSQKIEGPRIENLENTKKIVVSAWLDTYNGGSQLVKIYSYYKLDVRLSAQAQLSFNSSELD
ncbi:hypothetical protein SDC9_83521 [bioreactor metagenome]|uniref:Uncharacterized protein n=1 Tax=bioreactor metagenome TaxID=1076179 RepID=A0A644Z8D7_9ZZZZ